MPFHVAIADDGLEIAARIKQEADVENLIRILQSIKPLLRNIYGQESTAFGDPPDPLDPPHIGDNAERVLQASTAPHKGAETGISFIITKAQKAELRQRGYTEEQIREMKPQDAHRALGLIS